MEASKAMDSSISTNVTALSPIDKLTSFSITGMTHQLRAEMLEAVYVLKGLAILGQWTVFYASPNTGKTLLTLWLLREQIYAGELQPEKVFYINADDAFRGAVEKGELAEELGYQMLVPGINNFSTKDVLPLMIGLANHKQASGAVIILDTLKKFTELMEKRAASEFGRVARMFVSAGGTLICLAHTNKHKDNDGNSIYSGTSDIVDDADCAFVIEAGEANGSKIAEFRNIKARGDVEQSVHFSYEKTPLTYTHLINSIKRVEEHVRDDITEEAKLNKDFSLDNRLITSILEFIPDEGITKTELVKLVASDTAEPRRKIIQILDKWCGNNYWEYHRWNVRPGDKNAKIYFPTKCPITA
jgi:archaellum biogenesis ATPase FlaH